ncbi:UPF0575 protein C19orf67 homolog isoform X2 [Notolabrus celidotus]|uniref:UPF0575 protein C19orf67 homolog isoform X2 n=1 Tax=Notolabrus celidotus TaxID=1203425 RepID=UPI00148FF237|nr:UPF0575 protein C19orf67 homolog isoform X2 [Notolabrus celidotus]
MSNSPQIIKNMRASRRTCVGRRSPTVRRAFIIPHKKRRGTHCCYWLMLLCCPTVVMTCPAAMTMRPVAVWRQVDQTSKAPAEEVQRFLYTCQPYFNHVESTTRSTMSLHKHLPFDIYARLLDFSQQLCDRLEQLVLTIASYNLVCLDEANPDSVSHFCIGQSQLGQLRLTVFLYCKLTPYMSKVNTGLYKRMRWNVERLREDVMQLQQEAADDTSGEREDREQETVGDTEYYFLCCEDTPNPHNTAAREGHGVSDSDVVRMWSIGQWVQVNPDPSTQDIFDWILCDVPQGSYHRLLYFGSEEPLSCIATDHLHKLLKSHLDTGLI